MQSSSSRGPESASRPETSGWILDTHVHVYPSFDPRLFFNSAATNFCRVLRDVPFPAHALGCLVVLETPRTLRFDDLPEWATAAGDLRLEPTAESGSLLATYHGSPCMALVRGRQVRTRENLEVLVIGGSAAVPDGQPISETVKQAAASGAAVIIPWSIGKWVGKRGDDLETLLRSAEAERVHLGDTGNRPRLLPTPRKLERSREDSFAVLQGSDPLPFRFHGGRAGTCGVFLACEPDLEKPLLQLTRLLRDLPNQPPVYRSPEPLWRFLLGQLVVQLYGLSGAVDRTS